MSVHIFYLGQLSSGNFDSYSLVVIMALPEGAQIKVLGSSRSVRVQRQDLYSKHVKSVSQTCWAAGKIFY